MAVKCIGRYARVCIAVSKFVEENVATHAWFAATVCVPAKFRLFAQKYLPFHETKTF